MYFDFAEQYPKLLMLLYGLIAFVVIVGGMLLLLDAVPSWFARRREQRLIAASAGGGGGSMPIGRCRSRSIRTTTRSRSSWNFL